MKKRKVLAGVFWLFVSLCSFAHTVNAESPVLTDEEILMLLTDEDSKKNCWGVTYLGSETYDGTMSEAVKETLLQMAKNSETDQEWSKLGEYGERCYVNMIEAIGNTRDERAVPILMENLAGGMFVTWNLMKIGEPAMQPLIDLLKNGTTFQRSTAALSLKEFVKKNDGKYISEGESRQRIKNALIDAIKDKNNYYSDGDKTMSKHDPMRLEYLRRHLLESFGYLAESGDTDVIPIIKKHAKEDPEPSVREEAQKVLDRLRAKGIPVDEPGPPDTPPGLVNAPANPPAR